MSVERIKRSGYNVVYKVSGPFDPASANQFQDLNAADYYEIGDALGAVIDFRQMTHVTVRGLHTIRNRLNGVVFDTPVAFVGETNSIFLSFLHSMEALTSRGRRRFGFFQSPEEAIVWINAWFTEHAKDREELYGRVTTKIALPTASTRQTKHEEED